MRKRGLNWKKLKSAPRKSTKPYLSSSSSSIYLFWLHWIFVSALGLSPGMVSGGYSPVAGLVLLTVVASLAVEHNPKVSGLSSCAAQA